MRIASAVRNGNTRGLKPYLNAGGDISARHYNGNTFLHIAAEWNHGEVVKQLLKAGAKENIRNHESKTALDLAINNCRTYVGYNLMESIYALLIARGGTKRKKKKDWNDVLTASAWAGHFDLVKYLIEQGKGPQQKKQWQILFHFTARGGNPKLINYLIGMKGLLMKKNEYGYNALHIAAFENHTQVVQVLIDAGASINSKSRDGETALFLAVEKAYLDVVEVLISNGADLNLPDKYGITPLIWAARLGNKTIVETLLEAGVDIHVKDKDGWTALSTANNCGQEDIVKMLKAAGAKGMTNPVFKGIKHIVQRGYVLCHICKQPAQSLKEIEQEKKHKLGPQQYCPKCDAYYCHDHYKRGRWEMICTASDYQYLEATCPKRHKRIIDEGY